MKLFKMVKNIKIKILICYMVDEMVKKWGRASFYLSCNCTLCFLVKILLVKLKSLHTSACLNLNCDTAKQNAKIWRVQRWWNLSKLWTNTLTNFNLGLFFFSSLIFPPSFEDRDRYSKNTSWGKWVMVRTCGTFLLGGH